MKRSLTKKEILSSKRDLDNLFKNGNINCSYKNLRIKAIKNGLDYNRIIVSPVRNYGNAIKRNRVRRIFKEIFRVNKFALCFGFDIAFIVYQGCDEYREREKQFFEILKDAKILKKA